MIAGNNIGPAFDILDKAGTILQGQERNVVEVQQALATFYREKRLDEANASGDPNYKLQVTLLAAGFDQLGVGHLFRVSNPGICARQDIPGFAAIGSGSFGAHYMLLWREMDVYLKASLALYFAFEAKIFGESAPGVGYETDMYIFRKGIGPKKISKESEEKMERIWRKLEPRSPKPEHRRALERLKEIRSSK